jgi:hypothetical protein
VSRARRLQADVLQPFRRDSAIAAVLGIGTRHPRRQPADDPFMNESARFPRDPSPFEIGVGRLGRQGQLDFLRARPLAFEFVDALQRSSFQGRRVTRDRRLADALHLRHAAIERGDQLQQFTHDSGSRHRHPYAPRRSVCDRDTFHISPHFMQRQ